MNADALWKKDFTQKKKLPFMKELVPPEASSGPGSLKLEIGFRSAIKFGLVRSRSRSTTPGRRPETRSGRGWNKR